MSPTCGCSGTCGCCEGVEPVTPVTIVNRPGLPALSYRVGTHARFLRTMLSQLSQHELAVPTAERDERGDPIAELTRPLRDLRTRDRDDASIALLDAWATVADVLSFYQERIANEGYLRTATERRSVLELGRLLGYRMRPGVAATCYLAYTLEADARTVIRARNKVQSIPLPGERPQTFETVEDAEARGEWNTLAVARSRPVDRLSLADVSSTRTRPLYFKGVTTRLELNDPLLVDFGDTQELYRVVELAPEGLADRTKVMVAPWQPRAAIANVAVAGDAPGSSPPAPDAATLLSDLVQRYTDLSRPDAPRTGAAVRRVITLLERLQTNILIGLGGSELREVVEDDILPAIEDELRRARRRSPRVEEWLERLVAELRAFGNAGTINLATGDAQSTIDDDDDDGDGDGDGDGKPGTRSIISALDDLARPASRQPASRVELRPSLDATFAAASQTLPGLLTVMRPDIGRVLYDAWRNLEATPPSPMRVYALRARASAFGHAATPEPVRDDEGAVVSSREWTLMRSEGGGAAEKFEISLGIPVSGPESQASIAVEIADLSAEASVSRAKLLEEPLTLGLGPDEQVLVELSGPAGQPPSPSRITVRFAGRGMTFTTTLETGGSVTFDSDGSDPTHLRYSVTLGGGEFPTPTRWEVRIRGQHQPTGSTPTEDPRVVSLDTPRPAIVPGGWVVVERPPSAADSPVPSLVIARVEGVRETSRADYGITGRSTLVAIDRPWLTLGDGDTFAVIRGSAIYAQSEPLDLLDEPLDPVAEPVCDEEIPLERLYDGLEPGRRLIISGERTDVLARTDAATDDGGGGDDEDDAAVIAGVRAVEVAMLAGVRQDIDLRDPAAKTRSTLVLAEPLAYCYRRDTVKVYANVLKASHGESRTEVLGSGDGAIANQSFTLKQKPLTHVSAITPTGVASTLEVSVDRVRWHEADSPVGLSATDRRWVADTDDDDVTKVTFGNGAEGSRLPTGTENVTAVYRFGIGRGGNVGGEQLTLLTDRPSGVVGVTNPEPASGGADRENRDQARDNIPLAVTALDRIVSVQDYADFARTFAGIAKACATRLSSGRQELVHVTIAGEDDIPILPGSDLNRNLRGALSAFGDRFQPFRIDMRRLRLMVAVANVRVHPDHRWEDVEPAIRAALLDRFGFARRELVQDVSRSEVLSVVQGVAGVVYVDLDILDTVEEDQIVAELATPSPGGLAADLRLLERLRAQPARAVTEPEPAFLAAELIVLSPAAPQTLTLLEIR